MGPHRPAPGSRPRLTVDPPTRRRRPCQDADEPETVARRTQDGAGDNRDIHPPDDRERHPCRRKAISTPGQAPPVLPLCGETGNTKGGGLER